MLQFFFFCLIRWSALYITVSYTPTCIFDPLKLLTSNKLKIASRNIRGRGKGNLSSCESKSDLQEIKNNWNSLFYIQICTVSQLEQSLKSTEFDTLIIIITSSLYHFI